MSIRKIFVGLVAGMTLAATASALPFGSTAVTINPINPPAIVLDPLAIGAPPGGGATQLVCPNLGGGTSCPLGTPWTSPVPNEFQITMLNGGLFSASITESVTPGASGVFNSLVFQVWQGMTLLGGGSLGTELHDLVLAAGNYTMRVLYTYTAMSDNSSAQWSLAMTTGPLRVPEPATLALLGLALTGLAFVRRRT